MSRMKEKEGGRGREKNCLKETKEEEKKGGGEGVTE